MNFIKILPFCVPVIVCAFAVPPICAQNATRTGTIYGKVVDAESKPLNGVRVRLESEILAPVLATTTSNGNFRFMNIPPGNYSLSFFLQGFTAAKRKSISISIGGQTELEVILEPTLDKSGVILGTVTDRNGGPLEGVLVSVESDMVPQFQVTTSANGSYRFENLPVGKYFLTFKKKGYEALRRDQIDLASGSSLQINVELIAEPAPEKTAGAIERRSNGISWTYSGDYLRMLPGGDNIYAILDHTPAIDMDTINTGHSDAAGFVGDYARPFARGGNDFDMVWNYDGLNISVPDGFTIIGTWVGDFPGFLNLSNTEQVQIITADNDISIPTSGLTVNIVPKEGGREWHGSGSFFFSNHKLQSDNTPFEMKNDPRYQTTRSYDLDDAQDYGFEVGGSIIPDKLFIWGAYDHRGTNQLNPNTFLEENRSNSYNIRGNLNLGTAQRFQFGYYRAEHRLLRTLSDGSTAERLHKTQTITPGVLTAQYSWTPDDKTVLTTRYGYVGAGFQFGYISQVAAHDVSIEIDRFAENFLSGDHNLRFGFEYKTSGFHDLFFTDPGYVFSIDDDEGPSEDPLTEGFFTANYPIPPVPSKINRTSFYVADSYRNGRLSLDVGLRLDRQNGKNGPRTYTSPLAVFERPEFLGPGFEELMSPIEYPGRDPGISFDNLSPRIGASFDLFGHGKTVAYGSFSRYYQTYHRSLLYHSDFTGVLFAGSSFPVQFVGYYTNSNDDFEITPDEVHDFTLTDFQDAISQRPYASDLSNSFVNEYVIGIQTQLWDDFSLSAAFTHRSYHDSIVGVPDGLTPDTYVFTGTTTIHTTFGDFDVPFFDLPNFTYTGTTLLRNNRIYNQTYNGFELMLEKGWAHNLRFSGGLILQRQLQHNLAEDLPTWFHLPNNILVLGPEFNYSVLEDQPYAVSSKLQAPYSEWQFKFNGAYRFPWDLSLGAVLRYQQGYPYVLSGRRSQVNVFPFTNTFLVEPYGKRRLDNIFTLDLRLDKEFSLKEYGKFNLILEVFNVTNSNPVLERYTALGDISEDLTYEPDPQLGRILQVLSPRILRLGVRYSF